jgi:hypothetical protein
MPDSVPLTDSHHEFGSVPIASAPEDPYRDVGEMLCELSRRLSRGSRKNLGDQAV